MILVSSDVRDAWGENDHRSGHGSQRRSVRTVSVEPEDPKVLNGDHTDGEETDNNPPGKMVPDPDRPAQPPAA